jgi:enoyl-CoA hydratase
MALVNVDQKDGVATVTIERPEALNALNAEVLQALQETFLKLDCRVMILTGAGPKAFVAGADIAGMAKMNALEARAFVEMGQFVMQTLEEAPFISIAAVNGFALGGGCELAMACDLIYCSDNARFALPETNLGIIPGFGGTVNLVSRVGYPRALEMVLTGKMIGASEAVQSGLALGVYPAADLMTQVRSTAEALAAKGVVSMLAARRLVKSAAFREKERGLLLERETFASLFATGEPAEGMAAFLEKRKAKFS